MLVILFSHAPDRFPKQEMVDLKTPIRYEKASTEWKKRN